RTPMSAALAGERSDVDDLAPAPLHHLARDRLSDQERSREIDGDDPVPLLKPDLEERRVAPHAGVVDQDVDAAQSVRGGLDHGCYGCRISDVDGDRDGAPALL